MKPINAAEALNRAKEAQESKKKALENFIARKFTLEKEMKRIYRKIKSDSSFGYKNIIHYVRNISLIPSIKEILEKQGYKVRVTTMTRFSCHQSFFEQLLFGVMPYIEETMVEIKWE